HGRRNSARNPRPEGAFAGRQGRWSRTLLSLLSRSGRPGRRRAGAWPDARGDRARHEADGMQNDRPAHARKSADQIILSAIKLEVTRTIHFYCDIAITTPHIESGRHY